MAKKSNFKRQLILSFVASSMLYSQAFALPSGGNSFKAVEALAVVAEI